MVKIIDSLKTYIKDRNYVLIISPEKLELIEIEKRNKKFEIISKKKLFNNFFVNNVLVPENLGNSFKILSDIYKNIPLTVFVNLPIYFIQKFEIETQDRNRALEFLESKIKNQSPFASEKYKWEILYIGLDQAIVIFYNKEIIRYISEELIKKGFISIGFNLPIFSLIEFLDYKFSLYLDRAYIIISYHNKVFNICTYENKIIKNLYTEIIKEEDLSSVLPRVIDFSIKNLSKELEIIYYISEVDLPLPENLLSAYKFIDIKKFAKMNLSELISLTNIELKFKDLKLQIVSLFKEFFLYKINKKLDLYIVGAIILSLSINLLIWILNNKVYLANQNLQKSITEPVRISFRQEDLQDFTNLLKMYNQNKLFLLHAIDLLSKEDLKNYIVQANFNKNNAIIIIEEKDKDKLKELKEKIQNILPNSTIKEIFNGLEINVQF